MRHGVNFCAKSKSLGLLNVLRLRTLWPVNQVKSYFLTFGQGFVTITCDRRVVDENVRAAFTFDEAETLCIVEPLHFTTLSLSFTHNYLLLNLYDLSFQLH